MIPTGGRCIRIISQLTSAHALVTMLSFFNFINTCHHRQQYFQILNSRLAFNIARGWIKIFLY